MNEKNVVMSAEKNPSDIIVIECKQRIRFQIVLDYVDEARDKYAAR